MFLRKLLFQCLVFDPNREIVKNFLSDLQADLKSFNISECDTAIPKYSKSNNSISSYYRCSLSDRESYFEHIILESCLSHVTKKFKSWTRKFSLVDRSFDCVT